MLWSVSSERWQIWCTIGSGLILVVGLLCCPKRWINTMMQSIHLQWIYKNETERRPRWQETIKWWIWMSGWIWQEGKRTLANTQRWMWMIWSRSLRKKTPTRRGRSITQNGANNPHQDRIRPCRKQNHQTGGSEKTLFEARDFESIKNDL